MSKDYYEILEVDRNASKEDIKKSYRKLSKKYHPDLNPNDPECENRFKEIANAYSVLSDDEKKSNYDRFGDENGQQGNPFGGMGFDDIFSSFFNGGGNGFNRNPQRNRGSDVRIKIELSLEEVFSGTSKKLKYKRNETCGGCGGKGGEGTKCNRCNGNGFLVIQQNTPFGVMRNRIPCDVCAGQKIKITKQCNTCNGNGVNVKEHIVDIEIPKGIMDGEMMRFIGSGNSIKNGTYGDLLIQFVEKSHNIFIRRGLDLHQKLSLNYKDLVLGNDNVEVVTIDGKIRFKVRKGTQIGTMLRVPNKGIIRDNNRGDMILEIWLDIPTNLTEEEKNKITNLTF